MKTRTAMITTYNPGAAGPRFVAGHLMAHGHDVKFIHMKELRAVAVPTTDFAKHEELGRFQTDIQYVSFQHPGEVLYVPYPTRITETEIDLLISEIRAYDPHIVGISMFSVTVEIARKVTQWIHERLPGLPVIWGGIHCMVHPNDCLKGFAPDPRTGERHLLQVPDIVCEAEGEIPMLTLMDRWDEYLRGDVPDIPGLWFVKNGEVHKFRKLPFEKNLDEFAWPVYAVNEVLIDDDRTDWKLSHKQGFIQNHIYVFTERGCPYQCSFCIHSVINKMEDGYQRIRRRSVDHVLDEVQKRVEENGMKHMVIHDEIFAIQKPWIMEFAEKWEKRFKPLGITFTGYVHPLTTDYEMVEALFRAGLTRTGIGIQSGSARTTKDVYDRPLHRHRVIQMTEWLAAFPFELVQLDLISDSPYETDEDRRETLRLLLDLAPPFRVETFGLVTYSTTELVNKKRLMKEVPWKERLFWNMLYHLTGTKFLGRDTIWGLSESAEYRENPLLLEKLVVEINGQYFRQLKGQLRTDAPAGAESRSGEEAILEARRRAQQYNGALGSVEEERAYQAELAATLALADGVGAGAAGAGSAGGEAGRSEAQSWQGYRFKNVERRTL